MSEHVSYDDMLRPRSAIVGMTPVSEAKHASDKRTV
jgi:hypothetical protein